MNSMVILNFQVAALGRSTVSLAAAAAHKLVENIGKIEAGAVEIETARLAGSPAAKWITLRSGLAVLIVSGALLRVFERFVGLAELLEVGIVAAVLVGMVLHGLLAVGALDLVRRGGLGNS